MFPELVVHAHEAVARNDAHRDLIRQLLRLEIRVVREHPHVSQLVRDGGIEFHRAQALEEAIFDREPEGLASIDRCFDRHHERDLRFDRNIDVLRDPELNSQAIDDELETLGEECERFRGCGRDRTREREEEERTGRRQRDPRH